MPPLLSGRQATPILLMQSHLDATLDALQRAVEFAGRTVLDAGVGRTRAVSGTRTDAASHPPATATVPITVTKATPRQVLLSPNRRRPKSVRPPSIGAASRAKRPFFTTTI